MAAAVEIPMTQPHFSANADLTDNSKTDESITNTQSGTSTTVNVGAGGHYETNTHQNCGNQKGEKEFTRIMSTIVILFISLVCDVVLGFVLWTGMTNGQNRIQGMFNKQAEYVQKTGEQVQKINDRTEKQNEEIKKWQENMIWDYRQRLISEIDQYCKSKTITVDQLSAVSLQYDQYKKMGGNHGVDRKFSDFKARISAQDIKTVKE